MLIKIDFKPEDVVYLGDGRLVLRCRYYGQYSSVAHLVTTDGSTYEDFQNNPGKANKSVFVGQKGGITLE